MAAEENGQDKPFAAGTTTPYQPRSDDLEDSSKWIPSSSRRKLLKKRCIVCCGCCAAVIAIIAVIILALALTIYKVRDPEMKLNSITLQQRNLPANLTVIADVSVKNPNPVAYYFNESKTTFYYHDALVGMARGPSGQAAARRTYRLNVTVEVPAGLLLNSTVMVGITSSDAVSVDSSSSVSGHVKILGLVKHHVDVVMNCTVTVGVLNFTIMGQTCRQRVRT